MSRDVRRRDPPKHQRIADDLRSEIETGTYAPGDQLPGENALMESYGVARMTARNALADLQAQGLTTTIKGSGVFVRRFEPIRRSSVSRLAADRWNRGEAIWDADTGHRELIVDQIQVDRTTATGRVARALGTYEVIARSRRFVLDDKPVLHSTSHFPAELVAGSPICEPDTGPGGSYARLADLGYPPARFREELRSRMPTTTETERLELEPGTPVVLIARNAYTTDGTVVEINEMTLDASAYIIDYEFDA